MTLQELREMTDDTITPATAAKVLGCTGFLLGKMCKEEPQRVPFPFICIGRKTIIMREGFISWAEGRQAPFKVEPGGGVSIPGGTL